MGCLKNSSLDYDKNNCKKNIVTCTPIYYSFVDIVVQMRLDWMSDSGRKTQLC